MITKYSFELETAKTITGDSRVRIIEEFARKQADNNELPIDDKNELFFKGQESYWCKVQKALEYVVYIECYIKRCERLVRIESNKYV